MGVSLLDKAVGTEDAFWNVLRDNSTEPEKIEVCSVSVQTEPGKVR